MEDKATQRVIEQSADSDSPLVWNLALVDVLALDGFEHREAVRNLQELVFREQIISEGRFLWKLSQHTGSSTFSGFHLRFLCAFDACIKNLMQSASKL